MSVLKSLTSYCDLSTLYPEDKLIAYRDTKAVLWSEVSTRVEQWESQLAKVPQTSIVVHQNSGIELLAVLLAIWRLNKIAVIPSSTRRSHLSSVVCQTAISALNDTENFALAAAHDTPTSSDTALIIYTSGSTGQAQPCQKTFRQLNAEIASFETCWGQIPTRSLFANSVSRHHMYGLPFALLWPFLRGNPFTDARLPYLESLEHLPGNSFTLVSSPVQLANLPLNLNTAKLSNECVAVFSAGAPLNSEAAERCQHYFGRPVTEIYGSTETGAIARRHQTINDAWQLLPNTKLRISECQHIEIYSAAAGSTDNYWLRLSDIGEQLDAQHFHLKGRDDQIVKVGAKRISLNSINDRLISHPWVRDVRTMLLSERKSRIAAVICLTPEGNDQLTDTGRHNVNAVLLDHLGDHIETIAKPRYWRYLSAMPMNSQGKINTEVLESLFFSERQPRLPELVARNMASSDDTRANVTLFVPHQLFYFNGHFPGNAILPGVVQLSWVMHFARQHFPTLSKFQRLEVIKFQKIIRPGDTIRLDLTWEAAKSRLVFNYYNGAEQALSSGRIGFTSHD